MRHLAPLILLGALACDSDLGIAGQWTGSSTTNATVNLTLTETPQGVVSGAGVLVFGLTTYPINVIGAHVHPSLSLTIDFPRINLSPISFQGVLDGTLTSVKGVLNGSGIVRDTLVLNRTDPSPRQVTGP